MSIGERYIRNLGPLTEAECRLLGQKRVFLAGCGGLGGYLLEHLLRAGVGGVTACDGDVFQASNLNRQLLCTPDSLGRPKAEEARLRAERINPEVQVRACPVYLTGENAGALLAGHHLALDALDSPEARLVLARACGVLGIPLVHGAIQGWYAQAAVIPPGSGLMERIYAAPAAAAPDRGSLSATAALCASIQAAEAVKLLCGRPSALSGRLLCADLLEQDYTLVELAPPGGGRPAG